jgi:gas vesicle protein
MMATTIPMRPKRGPRVRESARASGDGGARDAQYDLLTAALIGAAIGATATLLLRRGPSGQRPLAPVLRGAGVAGRSALRASRAGAQWAREQGGELIDRIPVDRIEHDVRETVGAARDRIDGFVQHELRDLRRALRQQRKRMGI